MLFEIQGIDILLRRWSEKPDAPISEISPFSADRDKSRPYTREEIARRVAFMRKHAPTAMALLTADSGLPDKGRCLFRFAEMSELKV
jgi:hypothetical protein